MKFDTILQIDDDIDDCLFFKDALESISDALYVAEHDPVAALDKLIKKEIKPDLILLDINMPKMDGGSLLSKLRANKNTINLPVIILSTSPMMQYNQTAELNVLNYFVKPCDFNDLKKLVRNIMGIE